MMVNAVITTRCTPKWFMNRRRERPHQAEQREASRQSNT